MLDFLCAVNNYVVLQIAVTTITFLVIITIPDASEETFATLCLSKTKYVLPHFGLDVASITPNTKRNTR